MASQDKKKDVSDVAAATASLTREDQAWGVSFKAAHEQAKRYWPQGTVSYAALAERVSQIVPVSDTTILRLGYQTELPSSAASRQIAWLSLVAMGFDPGEFGLTYEDRGLRGLTDEQIRKMLDPAHLNLG